jgi:hypothetical protein
VKENLTDIILLWGVVKNRLYPLAGCKTSHQSLTCLSATIGVRAIGDTLHSRLGHSSSFVFDSLFYSNKLSVKGPSNKIEFAQLVNLAKLRNYLSQSLVISLLFLLL